MENLKKLVDAFDECGEAAAIYRGQNFLMVNDLFATIFGREPETFRDLPILEVCHNESIEMIRDFMHRRAIEDHGVPTNYISAFITADRTKITLNVIAIKLRKAGESVLIIVRKI
jgi:PAS domain S-box-containing protein